MISQKIISALTLVIFIANLWFLPIDTLAQPAISAQTATANEVVQLQLDQSLTRAMDSNKTDVYKIKPNKNQYLQIAIEPQNIDIAVKLVDNISKERLIDNFADKFRTEYICLIAPSEQDYLINVMSVNAKAPGEYRITLTALREAKPQDQDIVNALELAAAARLLRKEGSKDSLKLAMEKYQQASDLLKDREFNKTRADLLCFASEIGYTLDEYPTAKALAEQSLSISQTAGYRYGEACALNGVGSVFYMIDTPDQARNIYTRALAIYRELKDSKGEATILFSLGRLGVITSKHDEAMDYFKQSLTIARAEGDRNNEAANTGAIALLYLFKSNFQPAIDNFNQAVKIRQEMNDQANQIPYLHGLSSIYTTLGDYQTAMNYISQALVISRAIGARSSEGFELNVLSNLYRERGEYQKSLEYSEQALKISREIQSKPKESSCLGELGAIYLAINENQKALEVFKQALEIRKILADTFPLIGAYIDLGNAYTALNQFPQALEYYQLIISESDKIGFINGQIEGLYGLAYIASKENRLEQARASIEKVLVLTDTVRAKLTNEKNRTSYQATIQIYYNLYIDILMRLHELNPKAGYDEMALKASESARSRALLLTLSEQLSHLRNGADQTLINEEKAIQNQINDKALNITSLLGKVSADEKSKQQAAAIEAEIRELTQQLETVRAKIKQASPRYAALTQPQPLSLKQIQQQLDQDTVLLEFSLNTDRSYLWLVTADSFHSYVLANNNEIEKTAKQFRDLLLTRINTKDRSSKSYDKQIASADLACQKAANELGRLLLNSVAPRLQNRRLIIVADGALNYVPFAALSHSNNGGKYEPLILAHEIVNLPSASVITLLRQDNNRQKNAEKSVAVFADPVFTKTDIRYLQLGRKNQPEERKSIEEQAMSRSADESGYPDYFRRLNYSNIEAKAILSLVDSNQSRLSLGFQANKPNVFSDDLSRYRFIHFATHGVLNNREPDLSALVLSLIDEQGQKQDGYVRLHEIFNLNISAELVVLSACQTGLGKEIKGEGLIGLTRGFMYAGAPRIVASLWQVDDAGTAELMKRFYQGMLGTEKLAPAAALRAAQIELFKQQQWQSPFYWAAFTLQGEYR